MDAREARDILLRAWDRLCTRGPDEVVLGALREIGTGSVAEICEQFYAMLPDGQPARTLDERQQQLDSAVATIGEEFRERTDVLEQRFYALEDELHTLLLKYLRANGLA